MRSLSNGISARGRSELKRHLNGDRLTFKQAVLAKCYDCTASYADGKVDCGIADCPLHPFMSYRSKKPSAALATPKNGVAGTGRRKAKVKIGEVQEQGQIAGKINK